SCEPNLSAIAREALARERGAGVVRVRLVAGGFELPHAELARERSADAAQRGIPDVLLARRAGGEGEREHADRPRPPHPPRPPPLRQTRRDGRAAPVHVADADTGPRNPAT